ncbi:hypothetical protein FOA52_003528 [Chlamydomonas sp. UWO 241]|nr:hypothetical protein FOA52_003528 [Chlamydomonas sp. UWO 241]
MPTARWRIGSVLIWSKRKPDFSHIDGCLGAAMLASLLRELKAGLPPEFSGDGKSSGDGSGGSGAGTAAAAASVRPQQRSQQQQRAPSVVTAPSDKPPAFRGMFDRKKENSGAGAAAQPPPNPPQPVPPQDEPPPARSPRASGAGGVSSSQGGGASGGEGGSAGGGISGTSSAVGSGSQGSGSQGSGHQSGSSGRAPGWGERLVAAVGHMLACPACDKLVDQAASEACARDVQGCVHEADIAKGHLDAATRLQRAMRNDEAAAAFTDALRFTDAKSEVGQAATRRRIIVLMELEAEIVQEQMQAAFKAGGEQGFMDLGGERRRKRETLEDGPGDAPGQSLQEWAQGQAAAADDAGAGYMHACTRGALTPGRSSVDAAGRCLLTTTGVPAGSDVLSEMSAAFVLSKSARMSHCAGCGCQMKPGHALPCERCPMAVYCSEHCRDTDPAHSGSAKGNTPWAVECRRPWGRVLPEEAVLAVRLAAANPSDRLGPPAGGSQGQRQLLGQLLSHEDDIADSELALSWALYAHVATRACLLLFASTPLSFGVADLMRRDAGGLPVTLPTDPPKALELFRWMCRIAVNGVALRPALSASADERFGLGMFPAAALLNHSCRPNACLRFDGRRAIVRVTEALPEGAEVTISYGPSEHSMPAWSRQLALHSQYRFSCCCPACTTPAPLAEARRFGTRCPGPGLMPSRCGSGGAVLPPSEWQASALGCDTIEWQLCALAPPLPTSKAEASAACKVSRAPLPPARVCGQCGLNAYDNAACPGYARLYASRFLRPAFDAGRIGAESASRAEACLADSKLWIGGGGGGGNATVQAQGEDVALGVCGPVRGTLPQLRQAMGLAEEACDIFQKAANEAFIALPESSHLYGRMWHDAGRAALLAARCAAAAAAAAAAAVRDGGNDAGDGGGGAARRRASAAVARECVASAARHVASARRMLSVSVGCLQYCVEGGAPTEEESRGQPGSLEEGSRSRSLQVACERLLLLEAASLQARLADPRLLQDDLSRGVGDAADPGGKVGALATSIHSALALHLSEETATKLVTRAQATSRLTVSVVCCG